MELRSLCLDTNQRTTRVRLSHPDRNLDTELLADATERLLGFAAPFVDHLRATGLVPSGRLFDVLSVDADQKRVKVRVGEHDHLLDYGQVQNLLREVARNARREAVARKPDPAGLSPEARWEHLYNHGGDGWEMGRPTPPLQRYLTAQPILAGQRALVIGCGRGHEAIVLGQASEQGAQIIGIDIAPSAVQLATQQADALGLSGSVRFQLQDLFTWTEHDPSQQGAYDLVVEHNCFCAIEPHQREAYVDAVRGLLRPGGRLVGLFYPHDYPGGPPYGSTVQEIRTRLSPSFDIAHEEVPTDSVLTRAGLELLLVAARR